MATGSKILYTDKVSAISNPAADINKVTATDMNEIKTDFNNLYDDVVVLEGTTGWGNYADTQYDSGTPFALSADTDTILPNDSVSKIETQKPTDITSFVTTASAGSYTHSIINGKNGDDYQIGIDFIAVPTSPSTKYLDVWFDIGGAVGELYRRTISFPKGQSEIRRVNFSQNVYTLDTWESNGATIYIRSNGSCNVYDVRYIISRSHKAR